MTETSLLVLVKPPLVTEHEAAHYWPDGEYDGPEDEDCLFCSLLSQYLGVHPGAAPATLYEAELIRHEAGLHPSGGATTDDGIRGLQARYGWAPAKVAGWAAAEEALKVVGASVALSGIPTNAPSGSPIRHWLPNYAKGHRIHVYRKDTGLPWLLDPEAPVGYAGERVSWSDLAAFAKDPARTHTVATLKRVPTRKKVACAGGYLWSEPRSTSIRKGGLPLGAVCSLTATVAGGSWSFSCGGTLKTGTSWYRVTAVNGSALPAPQYASIGRF